MPPNVFQTGGVQKPTPQPHSTRVASSLRWDVRAEKRRTFAAEMPKMGIEHHPTYYPCQGVHCDY